MYDFWGDFFVLYLGQNIFDPCKAPGGPALAHVVSSCASSVSALWAAGGAEPPWVGGWCVSEYRGAGIIGEAFYRIGRDCSSSG